MGSPASKTRKANQGKSRPAVGNSGSTLSSFECKGATRQLHLLNAAKEFFAWFNRNYKQPSTNETHPWAQLGLCLNYLSNIDEAINILRYDMAFNSTPDKENKVWFHISHADMTASFGVEAGSIRHKALLGFNKKREAVLQSIYYGGL